MNTKKTIGVTLLRLNPLSKILFQFSFAFSWLCFYQHIAISQKSNVVEFEKDPFAKSQKIVTSLASGWFDVTYFKLDLNISVFPNYLIGKVTVAGACRQNNSQTLTLDLANAMHIDSVLVNGKLNTVLQRNTSFEITLDRPYQSGEILSVDIYYEGIPVASGFGSFVFDSHSGVPWVYSLSEPYGASDWWPCKNSQSDKADSADIIVTCDSLYKVGSQGSLVSIVKLGGKTTYHWKERYPIASYLISIAMSNYVQFSNWFRYSPTDSMEVLNYVLPEHYADAIQSLPRAVDMLSVYSNLFGLYPFIKEKYGHSEFTGGGMEHQTMTSLGRFDEDIVAHELAHQWFGDMITCRTWADLWLNEGFAQYSTALYREKKYGSASYWEYMDLQIQRGMLVLGIIGLPDTTTAGTLFNSALIYSKGASVLHMLRHVLGDSLFFLSMHSYANDPLLKYSTASTKDFQKECETVSGKDLDYFFKEWIYGENIPSYELSWDWKPAGDSSILTINLNQPSGRSNPTFFEMPIDFRISTADKDTIVTLFNSIQSQTFKIRIASRPTSVLLDPEGWILKRVYAGSDILPLDYVLEQNYPNPFNSSTTIRYSLPKSADVQLTIYDVLGREITSLVNTKQMPGNYEVKWSPQNNPSGVYFYRFKTDDIQNIKKMILLR